MYADPTRSHSSVPFKFQSPTNTQADLSPCCRYWYFRGREGVWQTVLQGERGGVAEIRERGVDTIRIPSFLLQCICITEIPLNFLEIHPNPNSFCQYAKVFPHCVYLFNSWVWFLYVAIFVNQQAATAEGSSCGGSPPQAFLFVSWV